MSKRTKQIIAIILCITMVIGFDNVYGYRTVFKYINSVIVTKAGEIKDKGKTDSESGKASDENVVESDTSEPEKETVEEDTTAPDAVIDVDGEETTTKDSENITDSSDKYTQETTTSGNKYNSNKNNGYNSSKNNVNNNADNKSNNNTVTNNDNTNNSNTGNNGTDNFLSDEPTANVDTTVVGQGEVLEGDVELVDGKNTRVQVTKAENFVKGGVYWIQSQTDWTKLAEISQTSTLENMTFAIYRRESHYDDWTLTDIKIGNENYPFSGSMYQLYTSSVINTNVVLFEYLSSKAKIGKKEGNKNNSITINYTSSVNAGLATNLVIDKGSTVYMGDAKNSNYYVKIKGTIASKGMAAGGLFSYVKINENSTVAEGEDETANIYLDGINNIDLSTITSDMYGKTAGGLIGDITGKINLYINSIPKTTMTVSAYATSDTQAAGGLIGRVGNGVKVTLTNTDAITLNSSVSYFNGSYGYTAGGLIGCVDNAEVYADSNGGIIQKSNVSALRYAGGLIGYANNSKIVVRNYTQNSGTYIYQYSNGSNAINLAAGGVIGKFYCDEDNSDGKLEISYIKSSNKTAATASNIRITTASTNDNKPNYNKRGGLVGIIDSGASNVYIHDINTDAKETGAGGDNCYYVNLIYYNNNVNNYQSQAESGGLAGVIAGTDIKIENVVFNYVYISGSNGKDSNSISGDIVGDIAARTGFVNNTHKNTKITIKNINVMSNYIEYVNSYHGGLFGVMSNTVVAMQGTIDLSKVPYKTYSNSQKFANSIVLLGTEGNRGFLASNINRSFIYEDTDCVYTRPITYKDDGTINEFDADNIKYSNWGGADINSTPKYCIDDIGNYGSVLKNVESVLQIDNAYDNVVTGKITKDTDGNYIIDSLGDALRFAVAGNTANNDDGYPKFGGNCFVDDGETIPKVTDILSYNYKITTDLDLQKAGIHGFVRNDDVRYAFTGSFEGVQTDGKNPVITLDFISKQKYGGLFTNATNATFKNLDITGYLHYLQAYGINEVDGNYRVRAAAGSLAAYASGNINIDNVNVYTSIKTSTYNYTTWDNSYMYCYGGMFGLYYPGTKQTTYECTNSTIAPRFSAVRNNSFIGGMIAWMRVNSSSIVKEMNITDTTIGTEIVANSLFSYGATNNYIHGRLSGFIGLISGDYADVGNTGNVNNKASSIGNATYASINMKNTTIDGLDIDMTDAGGNLTVTIGGALGYSWAYADVSIDGLKVRNSKIVSRGVVGGLVSFMNGRINLKDISLESFAMSEFKQTLRATYCSFLIGNGQNAITTIENYKIATDGKVTETDYTNFDEIVGLTVKLRDPSNGVEYIYKQNQNIDEAYNVGGIVNIIDSDFNSFTDNTGTYRSYVNKVVTTQNKYTRYYYNLFTDNSTDWTITNGAINNEKQFMTFTVSRYARDTFNRFIKAYFTGGEYFSTYNINNNLDLNGYSYYPAPMAGTMVMNFNNHTVTLYGEKIDTLEKELNTSGTNKVLRGNTDSNSQHYMMHAGLFNSSSGNLTVKDLQLTGSIANLGDKTGAISSISTTNTLNLNNIVFNNLKVANYGETGAGLMLAQVGVNAYSSPTWTKATIDKITTTGYDGQKPVAAALIGNAGNDSATNTVISFVNMKVEDEKLSDNKTGKVFRYASYIYNYKFTSDLTINNSYVSYRFSEDDCKNINVTYGDEIKNGVQYANVDRTDGDLLDTAINEAKNGRYIPYIYMERNIYVNPRNGNITEGCGTYEDPYIINNSKQLLTLYLYLTDKAEYKETFKGTGSDDDKSGVWQVVPVGGSSTNHNECSVSNGEETKHIAVKYDKPGFPTQDDLRTAYYKITADINLGVSNDMNDKNIAGEYCGLGTETYPFAGVIIGTKSESENYKIILPEQGTKTVTGGKQQLVQSTFGLIQYMGGAVVKDLDIYSQNYDRNAYYNVTEYGGGVAAKVVGGDNIIDNVNVRVKFNTNIKKEDNKTSYDIKGIGGYVGTVENGSLIFRDTQGKESVSKCYFENYADMATNALLVDGMANVVTSAFESVLGKIGVNVSDINARTSASYNSNSNYKGEYGESVGLYVGMVYDGYVVYEGYNNTAITKPYTLEKSEMGLADVYSDKYPLVNGFHMINGNVLDENTNGTSEDTKKITFNADATGKLYTVNVNNTQALEILTMALNSDSLSVYYCENNDHSTGYGYKNRCRKAAYDNVGTTDAITSKDRIFAKAYDDNKSDYIGYLYPYIAYRYIDYTNLTTIGGVEYDNPAYVHENYAAYKKTLTTISVKEKDKKENKDKIFNCIVSNVNKTDAKVANYTTTYVLAKNTDDTPKTYDLSLYDLSFKGIGGIYTYTYSDFRANFDGNGNIVKFYISRAYDDEVMYSGMFNQLVYSQRELAENVSDKQLEIGNFTIKNSIVYNPNKYSIMSQYNSTVYPTSAGVHTCSTGGVAGLMKGAWKLQNITWERDETINDDLIKYDISGYRSVGGIVGKIDNSLSYYTYFTQEWLDANLSKMNDIDFINCNLKGTNGYHISVTELGSTDYSTPRWGAYRFVGAGGLVGSIGTNLFSAHTVMSYGKINISSCDIDYVDVLLKNKGYGGGFVGLLGTRYNPYSDNDSQYASIGNVTVDGKDADGNVSHISNLTVCTDNTVNSVEDYSHGGMFGHIDAPRNKGIYGGNVVVTNYNLSDISVDGTRTKMHTADAGIDGDGGIIGSARADYVDLSYITFTGTNTIGTEYARKNNGGLIGRLYNVSCTNANNGAGFREDNTVNIYGCNLSGMNISAYNSCCGGYIGHTMIEKINIGRESTKDVIRDSTITSVNGDKIGGIVGYIYAKDGNMFQSWPVSNFINIDVVNTKVVTKKSTSSAGGVLGGIYLITNSSTKHTFKNINVYSENGGESLVQSGTYAGGLMGATGIDDTRYAYVSVYMDGYIGIGQKYDTDTNSWDTSTNTGVNIRAPYAGGLMGNEYTRVSETHPADIMVANNRIYSMRTDGNVDIYSGGLYGMYQLATNANSTFNSVTVKNNLIYTGRNNTNYQDSNKTTGGVSSGGLIGYMYSSANTNVYFPDVTLENNSIGYYDGLYDDRNNNWKNVTLDSKAVKLVKMTSDTTKPSTVSWDVIDDLSDTTIAAYSVAFGQFIGRHSQNNQNGQVYILNPKVTIDKDKVGSIPVIDVAMNSYAATTTPNTVTYQEGNPYNYRKYCHIVYIDDTTGSDYDDIKTSATGRYPSYISENLIISDEVNYQFGLFKSIVDAYRNLNNGVTDTKTKNYNYITGKRLNMYMKYNDNSNYSLCGTDNNYYDITYNVKENDNHANILNGVPVLIIDGLQPQTVGNYAAAILTNGGGVVSDTVINTLNGNNNANVNNSTMNKFWKITCENAYIDTDGSIHKIYSADTRFAEHQSTSIICNNYNRLSLANSIYDQYIDVGNGGKIYTITLLSYTYTCPVATSDGTIVNRIETIYIPVFVKEKVTVDSYIRVLSNEEYSLSNASKIGYKDEVTVSHDSIYTIYSEFVYDGIRNNKAFLNDKLHKFIYAENAGGVDSFTVGTKMTLIDYQTGKAYYYTVENNLENNNKIPFEVFKDKDGNSYEQRNISRGISDDLSFNSYTSIGYKEGNDYKPGEWTYKDDNNKKGIGVERYFIIVEPAETENNIHFQLKIATEAKDANNITVDEFFNKEVRGDVKGMDMTCIPGPIIKFGGVDSNGMGTDGVTYVKGKISADEEVTINSNIQVVLSDYDFEAPSPYWQKKFVSNTIDSANTDKYLEVSVTLLDEKGKVVAWPVGTNISVNGASKTVLDNNLIIYEYKDSGKEFAMNTVQKDILGKCYYYNVAESDEVEDMNWIHYDEYSGQWYYYVDYDAVNSQWITQYLDNPPQEKYISMSNQMDISLDFSTADIDEYAGKNYTVMLKLYRSDDPNYLNEESTKSYGGSVRQYSNNVFSESIKDLSVALAVDDILSLGINLYNNVKEKYEIPFTNKFDFSNLINKKKEDSDIVEWADKKYMATYRVYKKVEKSGNNDGDKDIDYNANIGNIIESAGNSEYQIINWDDSPFELYDDSGTKLQSENITVNKNEKQNVIITSKEFTADEIKNGTNGTKYVTEWNMNLKAKAGEFTDADLTNYKVTVTYVPYDKTADRPETDEEQTWFDFFIFTVTKLKTDM